MKRLFYHFERKDIHIVIPGIDTNRLVANITPPSISVLDFKNVGSVSVFLSLCIFGSDKAGSFHRVRLCVGIGDTIPIDDVFDFNFMCRLVEIVNDTH